MDETSEEIFRDTLVLETRVPLSFELLNSPLLGEELLQLNKSNEELMQAIYLLEESVSDSFDAQSGQETLLLRLEHKINVLMGMVSQLLAQQIELPEKYRVRLNAYAMEWCASGLAGSLPEPGQTLLVTLYLHAALPQPVRFIAEVKELGSCEEGSLVRLQIQNLGDSTRNALEKFIFRHHRRAIAQRAAASS